ncbi:MAG: hypothetical protein V9G63_13005 [Candidatus Competibacter sp.]
MQQESLDGKPLARPGDQALLDAYYQEPIKQAERFADLAKELFKLELAIPGIYAAALRLVEPPAANKIGVLIAFLLWAAAMILTLRAMIPRRYTVLESVVRSDQPARRGEPLSIEEYFQRSLQDKKILSLASIPLFFGGIIAAVWAVLI